MSNWFNNLGFNHIQRTQLPAGSGPANNAPANNAPAFTGKQGVDSFEPSNKLLAPQSNSVRDIVGSVSKMPVNEAAAQLNQSTVKGLQEGKFDKFPPIEG